MADLAVCVCVGGGGGVVWGGGGGGGLAASWPSNALKNIMAWVPKKKKK